MLNPNSYEISPERNKEIGQRIETETSNMVSLYHVKMYVPELKSSKVSAYVRWWPQMDAYGIYKEFGEVLKARKHSKLPDQEVRYEPDGETEIDLSHTPEQKEMLVKNKMAVTAFTMAFRDNKDSFCMSLVLNSKTSDWPSGKTWEIVQVLKVKHKHNNQE